MPVRPRASADRASGTFHSRLSFKASGPGSRPARGPPTSSESVAVEDGSLFPYRARPGQEQIVAEVRHLAEAGGVLLIDAPTGSGKTVAALAPLLEHAEAADHRIVYLVRTHAQEVQVLNEARAISHRSARPLLAVGLQGRQRRCLLLEGLLEMKGATAEEHGKLCADRKRATEKMLTEGALFQPPPEVQMPEEGPVDLADLDGCPYYARVLQADMDALVERFSARLPTNREYEDYCRQENICPYELAKKLSSRARLVTAPYAFFFHPHIRASLLNWLGVGPERVDLVIDEAHNIPDYLRDAATVALPQDAVRKARLELSERGDVELPEGPSASRFLDVVSRTIDELVEEYAREEDGVLPPTALEDALLGQLGGTSHRLDTWLGALATWGESVREERRRERKLPRSAVHAIALTILAWPTLEPPRYVKVVTREPRRGVEAYALDAATAAEPVRECHLSVHMSGTLAPLDEYRDVLGFPSEATRLLSVASTFPPEHRRFFYTTDVSTRYEEVTTDPKSIPRLAQRLGEILEALPVKTAVFFPSFSLMDKILACGLASSLPAGAVLETRSVTMGDLWRSIEGFKHAEGAGVLLGVTGGRIAEGVDFPDEELEAVVVVGVPYPKPTAKREALRTYLDMSNGRGWDYCVKAPAQRALLQAFGRMIRSEHDRGIGIILDRRAPQFARVLPGLAPLENLPATVRSFYGRRPGRGKSGVRSAVVGAAAAPAETPMPGRNL
jgi:DNA excision repair protein ERCC-2